MAAFEDLNALFQKATSSKTAGNEWFVAAESLAAAIDAAGVSSIMTMQLPAKISACLGDAKNPAAREGAIGVTKALHARLGRRAEPYVVSLFPALIEALDDKGKSARESALAMLVAFVGSVNPIAAAQLLPHLFGGMQTISWRIKVGCLDLLGALAASAPGPVGQLLPEIVPAIVENIWDTKPEVKQAARASLSACCGVVTNPDIADVVPALVAANANPRENGKAVDALMGTTFVAQVDRPTLAIIVPVLGRGLRDRDNGIKRKCCVIVDNMCRLVLDARDVEPFVDKLLPELIRVEEECPLPEIRAFGAKAKATLVKAIRDGGGQMSDARLRSASIVSNASAKSN